MGDILQFPHRDGWREKAVGVVVTNRDGKEFIMPSTLKVYVTAWETMDGPRYVAETLFLPLATIGITQEDAIYGYVTKFFSPT